MIADIEGFPRPFVYFIEECISSCEKHNLDIASLLNDSFNAKLIWGNIVTRIKNKYVTTVNNYIIKWINV